ncbi:hypothetical protein [Undibacterium sp.]|uniref:hypothetical protein n=1 Tax=Undibacterium sp. TaxID=1914977 RepID=UPI00374DB71A
MNSVEMLRRIMSSEYEGRMPSNMELAGLWARRLCELSHKLSEEELGSLMEVGAIVYLRGCAEGDAQTEAKMAIDVARKSSRGHAGNTES